MLRFPRACEVREPSKIFKKLCAFTLAEVLITLAIIGVVAALTIPSVVRNYREKQTVVAVKKAYSQLNQAFNLAQVNEGTIDTWDLGTYASSDSANLILQKIVPYLKILKNCENTDPSCSYQGTYKTLNGGNWANINFYSINNMASVILADGTFLAILSEGRCYKYVNNQLLCAQANIDINGNKPPNQLGVDTFNFLINKGSVLPRGLAGDDAPISRCCNVKGKDRNNGLACSSWIIKNENMDYLKDTVSW